MATSAHAFGVERHRCVFERLRGAQEGRVGGYHVCIACVCRELSNSFAWLLCAFLPGGVIAEESVGAWFFNAARIHMHARNTIQCDAMQCDAM